MTIVDLDAISTMINANPNFEDYYQDLPVETLVTIEDCQDIDPEVGDALQEALDIHSDYILF